MPNFTLIDGQIKADVWTNGSATSVKNALLSDCNPQEAVKEVGWWTVDGADFRHGSKTHEGLIIPTEGDDIVVQPEADGFMKLGDIKGEFAGAYSNSLGGFKADALTHGGQEGFSEVEIHFCTQLQENCANGTFLTNSGQEGFTWEAASDIWTNGGPLTSNADALVQQVNDFAGLINPDSMRPVDFANYQVKFETGLQVEGIGASNPMGIELNQMVGESFEPMIRNGYNCEDFGVCAG